MPKKTPSGFAGLPEKDNWLEVLKACPVTLDDKELS